jgi:uncharacterized protein YndB with AHSA1/START domain
MANPLKLLKLKPTGFQFIQEIPISSPPAKVWSSLLKIGQWFRFDANSPWPKHTLEAKPGGKWISTSKDKSTALHGVVTCIEPGKLLRISGQLGMTHLPVQTVVIFELQPKSNGKTTLLRLGHRTYGFVDADVEKRFKGGWSHLLPQIKAVAEKR